MSAPQQNEAEKNIEIWKVKKLIKRLEAARGNGTSMISLIIRKRPSATLFPAIRLFAMI
jgi:peptide chain release factor subunit 1